MRGIRLTYATSAALLAMIGAGCAHEIESPPASGTSVVPDLVCTEQLTTTVVLSGNGFTPAPEQTLGDKTILVLPSIQLDRTVDLSGAAQSGRFTLQDDPNNPNDSRVTWQSEQQMSFEVFPELALLPGLYNITVTNPDAVHKAVFEGGLAAVPAPTVEVIEPDIACNDQEDQTFTLTGTTLLDVGGTLPIVHVGDKNFPVNMVSDCLDVPGTHAAGQVQACKTASFIVPRGSLPPGSYDVTVTNPEPANCVSSVPVKVVIVPPPSVTSIAPDLVCNAQGDESMTVNGTGFLTLGMTNPTIIVGTETFSASSAEGCTAIDGTFVEGPAQSCTTIKFTIPAGTLKPGDYPVVVTNPIPADCKSVEPINLHVAPPPSITSSSPLGVCDAQGDTQLTIDGLEFLQIGTDLPTVTIGTQMFDATSLGGCMPVAGMFSEGDVQSCTSVTITIPQGTLMTGTYPVVVTNPAPADCSSTEMIDIEVRDPPNVTSVVPASLCQGGGKLVFTGTGFAPTATVTLEAAGLPTLSSVSTMVDATGTTLTAQMQSGGTPGSVYDAIVSNGDGCKDDPPYLKVTITPGPIAFFADPDVVYNGINTRVTVYATTLAFPLPANAVEIVPTGQTMPITQLQWNPVPMYPNRVQVVIPKDQPPGSYDLFMNDATGCSTVLQQALTITDKLEVSIKSVQPPFGYTQTQTDVTIFRDTMAPAPADKPFVATPRVFFNPANPMPTDIAIQLQSVSFQNADTLTAVVPKNQPANTYDMIVVNPDGTVGLLYDAFRVQTVPPPTVTAVTPSSIVSATNQMVTVTGQNFSMSTISLTCKDAMGTATMVPMVTSGMVSCTGADCTQTATIDGSVVPSGSTCILRLTNADGSYFDYSAIGVTNASLNLSNPKPGPMMNTGRRALGAAAGNATAAARFIYAIGGDGGAAMANAPFNSVEAAGVDLFGNIGPWGNQQFTLNAARAFAGSVTAGRYIYVTGGTDGTNTLATVERARILDPLEVPQLNIDDIVPADTGLDGGYWIYRVSAVFSAADLDNPNGESLASDPLLLKVPALMGKKIKIMLSWAPPVDSLNMPLPNVAGYRIYRTPMVNGVSGDEVRIAEVGLGITTFADDGTAAPSTEKPLPTGSTGAWRTLPAMNTPRKGHAAAIAPDPADPKNKFYVYSLLGANATGASVTSYEYLPVTIAPNGRQTVGTWTTGANAFSAGRWQTSAWVADNTTSTVIPAGETWIYVGGGFSTGTMLSGKVEAAKVNAGGELGSVSDVPKDFTSSAAGYGVCAANGHLFQFGGQNGTPSSGAKAATLISPAPTLNMQSWNAEGLNTTEPRYLMGSAVQSAFIFLIGGQTAASAASQSTELVVW
ncbi:MAG TPA: IPT/TIG domain-containing protein [Polyangium sp.]|nr:IPT/TIG domain-containing protein [Polyangium sp.]